MRRCGGASPPLTERVAAYHPRHGQHGPRMAVLVQAMVDPMAAGVAFTVHPVSGDPDQVLVTAVPGLGDPLVSGEAVGEGVDRHRAECPEVPALPPAVGAYSPAGSGGGGLGPQDRRPLQPPARHRVGDRPRGAGCGSCRRADDGRAGAGVMDGAGLRFVVAQLPARQWLPEAVAPLFATWLPALEEGYLDGMRATVGVRVPFRYARVNGWYHNAPRSPTQAADRVLWQGRGRAVRILYNALIRVSAEFGGSRSRRTGPPGPPVAKQPPARLLAAGQGRAYRGPHGAPRTGWRSSSTDGRKAGIYLSRYLAIVGGGMEDGGLL